ncbi:MAG TPA: ACT domain-containing protein [bacterium]|nr:ACT domain-containing protein [bacterium]
MTARPEVRAAALLAQTRVRVDPRAFVIVGVPSAHQASLRGVLATVYAPFFIQIFPHEQTLVLPEDEWTRLRVKFPGAREEPGYRLITLEVVLNWAVTGYLAAVTAALAEAGIPVGVLSSFHHDHLLVRDVHLTRTEATLEQLIDAARDASPAVPDSREILP